MTRTSTTVAKAILALMVAAGPACSFLKPHSDPARYYVLTAQVRGAPAEAERSIGLARVSLPEYLNRADLVTRTTANALAVSEFEMWAEPLRDGFRRTLSADLGGLMGADRVIGSPWDSAHPPDLAVDVEVRRFERVGNAGVELEAVFKVTPKSGAPVAIHQSTLRRPVAAPGTDAMVAAMSQTVADLAAQIAAAARAGSASTFTERKESRSWH
jgi:uncharacterized lipoprotein YmbA